MDGNDVGAGKCPVMHANLGVRSNRDWWPNQLNLGILRQHSEKSDPMGDGFDYAEEFKKLDLDALKKDIAEQGLDRIVVTACSPLLHEKTFRKAAEDAGLTPIKINAVVVSGYNENDLADLARLPVYSVDYSLAPGTRFPTQIDQTVKVIQALSWIALF